jgi:hypothetical protein
MFASAFAKWQWPLTKPVDDASIVVPTEFTEKRAPPPAAASAAPVAGAAPPIVAPGIVISHTFGRHMLVPSSSSQFTSTGQKVLALPPSQAVIAGQYTGFAVAQLVVKDAIPVNCTVDTLSVKANPTIYTDAEGRASQVLVSSDASTVTVIKPGILGLYFDKQTVAVLPTGGDLRRAPMNAWACLYAIKANDVGYRMIYIDGALGSLHSLRPHEKTLTSPAVFSATFEMDPATHFNDITDDLATVMHAVDPKKDTLEYRRLASTHISTRNPAKVALSLVYRCDYIWLIPVTVANGVIYAVMHTDAMRKCAEESGVVHLARNRPGPFLVNQMIECQTNPVHREYLAGIVIRGIRTKK